MYVYMFPQQRLNQVPGNIDFKYICVLGKNKIAMFAILLNSNWFKLQP
jgi:hypothetical protein